MTTGLQIINDAGTILLDENYKNLALRQKGTVTLDANGFATLSLTGLTSPVVAVRCSTAAAFYTPGKITGTPGASVTYYVFDVPISSGLHQGLQVFNAAGELCFDSSRSYARVRAVISGSDIRTQVGTFTYETGRTYAVAFPIPARSKTFDFISSNCPPDKFKYKRYAWDGATKIVNNVVTLSFWQWRNETSYGDCTDIGREPKEYFSYPFTMMVLDVTGY